MMESLEKCFQSNLQRLMDGFFDAMDGFFDAMDGFFDTQYFVLIK